jgi:hypothetical protein
MRIIPAQVIPIFREKVDGPTAAQLLTFDVYYSEPPVVGFQVVGCDPEDNAVVGLSVGDE